MRLLFTGCLALVLIVAVTPLQAQESWVLYDDFNGTLLEFLFGKPLDADKWVGNLERPDDMLDVSREIRLNKLHLRNGSHNTSTSIQTSTVRLKFRNPEEVIGIKATAEVNAYELSFCPRNRIRGGRLSGSFFNTGMYGPSPGSDVGDVLAAIEVQRAYYFGVPPDPPNVFHVKANVFLCTDETCLATAPWWELNGGKRNCDELELGTVRLHEKARLRIQWDREDARFIFQLNDHPPVTCPYTVPVAGPANGSRKVVDVSNRLQPPSICPDGVAFIDVLVDDVFVILTDDAFGD